MIKEIDNASIVVHDLKSAVKWYRDVMGLKHKFTEESIQWAEMDAGGRSTLALKTKGNPSVCFVVTDLDEEMKRLKEKGVSFDEVFELPGGVGRVTSFKDPWGNEIDFFEPPRK
ncbi:MAG: VOC family protein [Candidatus Bathyarchaeota archaeon]|nr:MAG: VOC family protein [Candidatus Bathyarchaeota archaeon]